MVVALFKALLSAPGHRLGRDHLLELFWPEIEPEQGAIRLRATVHRLRRALGDAGAHLIQYRHETLALVAGDTHDWLDAGAFEAAARAALAGDAAAPCRAALALHHGEYLPEDPYAEWAVSRREEIRSFHVALLLHAAPLYERAGEHEEAEACLRAVLVVDRCHEEAASALMRLYAGAGRPTQACRVYERLAAALRDDLDLAPEAETQRLYRAFVAQRPAQRQAVPPIERALPTNLSSQPTSFVGRKWELAEIRRILRSRGPVPPINGAEDREIGCRLLTLTGPGGCGKTRLALQAAGDLLEDYADGVWLAELAALPGSADPQASQVARAVSGVLGLRDDADRPLSAVIVESLRARHALLVLDNCEHVLEECAALAASLSSGCPAVQILATSREALGVAGEQVWPVPPLTQPEAGAVPPPERLLEYESVRLFLNRARAQQPSLALTAQNAPAVVDICRRLEGLPLALELAAARVGVLGIAGVAARLSESMRLLAGGPRSAPARQRTLRAALDWSYALLSATEQSLMRRLAVFAGGCTLEAAEAVCDGGIRCAGPDSPSQSVTQMQRGDILESLGSLVGKSLLSMQEQDGEVRYRLLEPVRQYCLEKLAANGEQDTLQRRHAAYFLELAEEADRQWQGPGQRTWPAILDREQDNLRAALAWTRANNDAEIGLRLAAALWRFWRMRGYLHEGRAWLEELLRTEGPATEARARALLGAGTLARDQGDLAPARAALEASLSVARSVADRRLTGAALCALGTAIKLQGDLPQAKALTEEALVLAREEGDSYGAAIALDNLGNIAAREGDHARAIALHQECLAVRRGLGDLHGIGVTLNNLAIVAYQQGDYARSAAWLEETVAHDRRMGDKEGLATSLGNLGSLLLDQGQVEQAMALLAEGLILKREVGDKDGIAYYLFHLAQAAQRQGDGDRAARLLGASGALWATTGISLPAGHQAEVARTTGAVREMLGEAAFAAALAGGQGMGVERAVAYACSELQ
jgi:predicted ATPase/DNA-binding SARP family transcriptional activator